MGSAVEKNCTIFCMHLAGPPARNPSPRPRRPGMQAPLPPSQQKSDCVLATAFGAKRRHSATTQGPSDNTSATAENTRRARDALARRLEPRRRREERRAAADCMGE
eukprot:744581-Prymnesium_polylepis.1